MAHLTTEEIIGFVCIDQVNEETAALAKKVNRHILTCPSCQEKVEAFRTVQSALRSLGESNSMSGNKGDSAKGSGLAR